MKGKTNGSQVSTGVELDHIEHGNAGRSNIECHGEDVVNPCHLVLIHSTTADENSCETRSVVKDVGQLTFPINGRQSAGHVSWMYSGGVSTTYVGLGGNATIEIGDPLPLS